MSVFNNCIQSDYFIHSAGRMHAAVAAHLHEGDFAGQGDMFHQISCKHECAIENNHKDDIFSCVFFIDARGQ